VSSLLTLKKAIEFRENKKPDLLKRFLQWSFYQSHKSGFQIFATVHTAHQYLTWKISLLVYWKKRSLFLLGTLAHAIEV